MPREAAFGQLQNQIGNAQVQRLVELQRETPSGGSTDTQGGSVSQDRAEAKKCFLEADTAYKDFEFELALAGYQKAHELSKEPLLLYNIAQCQRNLGNVAEAVVTYQLFVTDPRVADSDFGKKALAWIERLTNPSQDDVSPQASKLSNKEAKKLFASAEKSYKAGDYVKAAKRYQACYESTKEPLLLYNVGQCMRNLGNLAEAKRCYEKFLADCEDTPFHQKATKFLASIDETTTTLSEGAMAI